VPVPGASPSPAVVAATAAAAASAAAPTHLEAARSAGPVAAAGVIVNLAVAATTLTIARLLNSRDYGTFVQLVAIFYVLSMPGLALGIAVVRRVNEFIARQEFTALDVWVRHARRQVMLASAAGFAIGAALSYPIAHLLEIRSTPGLIETFAAGALWAMLCFERSMLQARTAYPAFAANLLLEGVLRCAVTPLAVAVHFGVPGAAAALLLSLPAAIVHGLAAQRRLPPLGTVDEVVTAREFAVSRSRHEALYALLALGMLAILQNVDLLVLGRHDPSSSGSYGAVSVASKALVLFAFVLAGFLLPEAASRRAAGNHALTPLAVSLLFVAVPAVLLLLLSVTAAHSLLSIAFGTRLAGSSAALTPLALAMTLLAASVMLTHYLLAAGVRIVIAVLSIAAVATTLALLIAGSGPRQVAWTDAAAQGALLISLTGLVVVHHRKVHSQ
jgi:O-antigen/teichoic acid export membrane protein